MNKADGGNRKFILIEMMDYAKNITAERVRRVIDGYGEGKNAVSGTGGGFGYYELGERLFLEGGNLNPIIDRETIREYIWYMEKHSTYDNFMKGGGKTYLAANAIKPVFDSMPKKLPQFVIENGYGLFSDQAYELVDRENLKKNFTPADKDIKVDFSSVDAEIAKVDVDENGETPKAWKLRGLRMRL